MTSLHIAPPDFDRETAAPERAWLEHLQSIISANWRPEEFDHGLLRLIPKISPQTVVSVCQKTECGVLLESGRLCPGCNTAWNHAQRSGIAWGEWLAQPRQKRHVRTVCDVAGCPRTHRGLGLCATHLSAFKRSKSLRGETLSSATWIAETAPKPARSIKKCDAPDCLLDCDHKNGLCQLHYQRYRSWSRRGGHAELGKSVKVWFDLECEPLLTKNPPTTFATLAATPFMLLPEPLRWEFLYAVQQRDLSGRTKLSPVQIRGTYLALRRSGVRSTVGAINLGIETTNPTRRSKLTEWQRLIDDAHRDWSGVDRRDPNLLYLLDLTLKRSTATVGPNAAADLGQISQEWIVQAVRAWAKAAPRGPHEVYGITTTWTLVSRVLAARATPISALSAHDVDAIMKECRSRWSNVITQKRAIGHLRKLIAFSRNEPESVPSWKDVSAQFNIDGNRHVAVGVNSRSARDADEPFRFVPQPIVDWLMDHLHILRRSKPYLTAEARALIFVHERSGRRTSETLNLADDCISYDSAGSPYLEWVQGKPPYHPGKRLPIHQETHDVIRQWQTIKREHGVESEWLFPSQRHVTKDAPYAASYLSNRLNELITGVLEHAPFVGTVEGHDGNLMHFDLKTIDPYSFRHAFAQRLADAVDENGQSTTTPDVLQDYMGHKSFNTTMGYYQVTAKRRLKALESIPPRRLDLRGQPVAVDRERDGFTKIAVSLGHCSEPQNVNSGGHSCVLDHACESCPFFLVDPLERDGIEAKRHHLSVKKERALVIQASGHMIDHYEARIDDFTRIINGIDAYVEMLNPVEKKAIKDALTKMSEIRRRASAPRTIDLRALLTRGR